jgi:hypothetical protein
MEATEVSFVYSLEKAPSGDIKLLFGKSRVSEGYTICTLQLSPGSEGIEDMIVESLN